MKKFSLAMLAALLFVKAIACDICGGGVNTLDPYLFPHLSRSYMGLAYMHNHYQLAEDGAIRHQYNNAMVLNGQFAVANRLQLLALVPFQFNTVVNSNSSVSVQGLGDITLLANYLALQKTIGQTQHVLSAGAGIKLATGEYNSSKTEELNDQNFQLGSGSTDYLANLVYRFTIGNFSFNTLGAYKYTTANKDGYRYGDVLTTGATAVYIIKKEKFSLVPYLQATNEVHYRDADKHVLQYHSGGDVLYAGAGLDISVQKISVGLNYQAALSQNLIHGELQAKPRISARLSFSF